MKRKNYIDRVYYIVFGSYFILCFEMIILILLLKANALYFILGWIFLAIIGLFSYCFYNRDYHFDKDHIRVKLGFITKSIPYKSITNCYITNNNRLSYATSTKRIGLTLKDRKNDIYISPEQMDEILILLRKSTDMEEAKPKAVKKTVAKKAPAKKETVAKKPTTKTAAKKPAVTKKATTKKTTTAKKATVKKTSKGSK